MTSRTLYTRIVLFRINAPDIRPSARGVWEREMAPETERPAPVDSQLRRIRWMIDCRAMAVLALNDSVRSFIDAVVLVGMTILAVFFPLILYLEILPVFFIPLAVPAIHEPTLLYAEILGDENHSGQ